MRVLQIIDSLHPGGAERMAVTLANELLSQIDASFLCCTREEGDLKTTLKEDVGYLFLARTKTIDATAFKKLKKYIKQHNITHLHAHGTSFFIATCMKFWMPSLHLIWHEHLGNRVDASRQDFKMLKFCSRFFSGIITVNEKLKKWAKDNLHCNNVYYVKNFVPNENFSEVKSKRSNTIVCLANLREPKSHKTLLEAFYQIVQSHQDWNLLLIGSDYNDAYSETLKKYIEKQKLSKNVQILGTRTDVSALLKTCKIGVLSSTSEGLPMALLEYGVAGLAVVSTDVGQCAEVIRTFGSVVAPSHVNALAAGLLGYIEDKNKRNNDAFYFQQHIAKEYSASAMLTELVTFYKN